MLTKVKKAKSTRVPGFHFAIVASKYNGEYVDAMVGAAERALTEARASVRVVRVPGAYEIPALHQRARTGRGQYIDISLAHSILYFNEFAAGLLSGAKPPRSGSTAQTLFTTSDEQSFSAGNPVSSEVFATFCRVFGRPELIDDERFVDSGARRQRRAELLGELQAALLELGSIEEVEALLREAGLAVGRVRRVVDVPDTAWAIDRGAVVTAHVDGDDDVTLASAPWRFSGAIDQAPHELGAFGADNDAVLADLLDFDAEAIAGLYDRGVLRRDDQAVPRA